LGEAYDKKRTPQLSSPGQKTVGMGKESFHISKNLGIERCGGGGKKRGEPGGGGGGKRGGDSIC